MVFLKIIPNPLDCYKYIFFSSSSFCKYDVTIPASVCFTCHVQCTSPKFVSMAEFLLNSELKLTFLMPEYVNPKPSTEKFKVILTKQASDEFS